MKTLLIATALLEAATGLALSLSPALPGSLLPGVALDTPGGLTVAQVAGAALLAHAIPRTLTSKRERTRRIKLTP